MSAASEEAEMLSLAITRLYVILIYKPLKPIVRWMARKLTPKGTP